MASTPRTTFRTQPALISGVLLIVATLALSIFIVRGEGESGRAMLTTAAIFAGVVSLIWLVLLRPSVRIDPDGVEIRNLVTDVTVPFAALEAVGHRWSLELVDVHGKTHSSWAIPVKRRLRPTTVGDSFADATSLRRGSREGTHAELVAGLVEQAQQRWRLDGGRTDPQVPVVVTVSWVALLPVLVTALLAAVLILTR